jgi:hypothetical protein
MGYHEYPVNAKHTGNSVILFAVEVWDALEDVKIDDSILWKYFETRNIRYNLCLFYQNFGALCFASQSGICPVYEYFVIDTEFSLYEGGLISFAST